MIHGVIAIVKNAANTIITKINLATICLVFIRLVFFEIG